MNKNDTPSQQAQDEALKIARATQKPGQTKEQTKLIAQGIAKGIAQYKKQQKERNRKADKAKKQAQKAKVAQTKETTLNTQPVVDAHPVPAASSKLPWLLLVISWLGFILLWMMRA
ncbi:DUF2956 domain-containing protein [Vibrio sp. WXL210]|uniref:DUF2956 domain-containing protein n=1 Tax=Vibrio sp. WXL210 TaxID=3450709 RepID=UPI003EC6FB4B